ncbi:MAG: glycosyltransferase family 39 protein [Acidobacteria bacterium]|nr:glycosyltransferase family 39 protein [Acidobacteriota bacterium]
MPGSFTALLIRPILFLLVTSIPSGSFAQTSPSPSGSPAKAKSRPSITASLNPVPPGPAYGTTKIVWNTGDGAWGQVYVSDNGAPEKLAAQGPEGTIEAPWIGQGNYEFRLYAGQGREKLLASVNVRRAEKAPESPAARKDISRRAERPQPLAAAEDRNIAADAKSLSLNIGAVAFAAFGGVLLLLAACYIYKKASRRFGAAALPVLKPLCSGPRLRELSPAYLWILTLISTAGAVIRVASQVGRPFIGDEVGSLLSLQHSYTDLMTHFGTWQSMNAYLMMLKALSENLGSSPWVLVMPTLMAGIALVPLVCAVASRLFSARLGLLAAALTAFNPFLIECSLQIRSYSLLAALSLACLVCFIDWCNAPGWLSGIGSAAFGSLALLMHLNAIYFLAFLFFLLLIWFWHNRSEVRLLRLLSLLLPMVILLGLAAATLLPLLPDMAEIRGVWSSAPPTSVNYLPTVMDMYFTNGFWLLPTLFLLVCGFCSAARRSDLSSAVLLLGILIPPAATSLMGVSHYPWAYARFLIDILPLMLIVIVVGIDAVSPRRWAQWLLLAIVTATWAPRIGNLLVKKDESPWPQVAAYLRENVRTADYCLSVNPLDETLMIKTYTADPPISFISAQDFANRPEPLLSPGRLFVINSGDRLLSDAPQRIIGSVQILLYSGPSLQTIGTTLLDDLRRSLNKRVAPKFVNHYRLTVDLMSKLSQTAEQAEYTSLYYECRMRTRRQRYLPGQFLEAGGEEEP